ncbi:hypothetical protein [Dysgonomonas sp. HGC4]|uniref:hypothetical protein n=1 Tax=Dysgonomonas sp. HGC4 TaxID=1658009 RepID=UPI0009E1FEF5|nr:hypothetical protein [Dysgonomonas sp. HGC4]MBD8347824.1 hypothetical protein [Dysgonomonas sp. HGC4]
MERLINTKLFCLLEKMDGTFNPDEPDIAPVYNDFVRTVTSLCTSARGNVPTYFTLHYTRLELEGVQILLSDEGAGEKCPNLILHYPLSVIPIYCPAMGRM